MRASRGSSSTIRMRCMPIRSLVQRRRRRVVARRMKDRRLLVEVRPAAPVAIPTVARIAVAIGGAGRLVGGRRRGGGRGLGGGGNGRPRGGGGGVPGSLHGFCG